MLQLTDEATFILNTIISDYVNAAGRMNAESEALFSDLADVAGVNMRNISYYTPTSSRRESDII